MDRVSALMQLCLFLIDDFMKELIDSGTDKIGHKSREVPVSYSLLFQKPVGIRVPVHANRFKATEEALQ